MLIILNLKVEVMKKKILVVLALIILASFLVGCDEVENEYFQYDEDAITITEKNIDDYFEWKTPEKKVSYSIAKNTFDYSIKLIKKDKANDRVFSNGQITFKVMVNEKEDKISFDLNEINEQSTITKTVYFTDLKTTYNFNTSCTLFSASGGAINGRPPRAQRQEKKFLGTRTINEIGYIKYFGKYRSAVFYGQSNVSWNLSYLNPRDVFYVSNRIYTKSGQYVFYDGAGFLSGGEGLKGVNTVIFDGEYNAKYFDKDTIGWGGYITGKYDIKSTFPNIKNIYIRDLYNIEALAESYTVLLLPESGVNFYIGNGREEFAKFLEKSNFVNGVYPIEEFNIIPYQGG